MDASPRSTCSPEIRSRAAAARSAAGLALLAALCPAALADTMTSKTDAVAFRGQVTVTPALAARIAPDDRLVLKLYHPRDGAELDAKYQIIPAFVLPIDFIIAPAIDMSGRTKWPRYVVEAFTDRDGDVTRVRGDELLARTARPLPVGSSGIALRLEPTRP